MAVKAIPDGYYSLTPYLVIKGAAEAIEYYKKVFGATESCGCPVPADASCTPKSRSAIRC